jgi:hypothetical protein
LFLWVETDVNLLVVGGAGLWDVATGSANGAISANGCQNIAACGFGTKSRAVFLSKIRNKHETN